MEAVHVFRRIDREQDLLRVNLFRKRKLDEDSVDVIAMIELVDQSEQVFGGNVFGGSDVLAVESEGFAGLDLVADVNLRGRIVTDENGGEPWANSGGAKKSNLVGDFILNLCGDGVSVQDSS
jgi:hypothetical protein